MIPEGYSLLSFNNNIGGLKTRQTVTNIPSNSASDLRNVNFDTNGAICVRNGYTKLNSSVVPLPICLGLFPFTKEDGTHYLVGVFTDASTTKIYKMDDYDGSWDDITGALSLTASETGYVSFTMYLDTLIGTDGINAPWKWTGTGNAAALSISEFTLAKFVTTYKDRLVFFHTTESATLYPHRARWSNSGTIETYSAADYTDEFAGSDNGIAGVRTLYDEVYVFKNSLNNGIKKLYYTGNADVPFAVASSGEVGTLSHFSISEIFLEGQGAGLIYLGTDKKIRFFNGSYDASLSDDITPTIAAFNSTKMSTCYSCNFGSLNQVWFTFANGSSTSNNRILVFDTRYAAFLLHDNISANVLCCSYSSSNVEYLLSGGTNGYVYRQNIGNKDDNSSFTAYYCTAWLDFGSLLNFKKFGWVQVYINEVQSVSFNIGYNFDYAEGVKTTKTFSVASSADTFPFTFPISLYGLKILSKTAKIYHTGKNRVIRFKFSSNNTQYQWKIYGFNVIGKILGIKDLNQ